MNDLRQLSRSLRQFENVVKNHASLVGMLETDYEVDIKEIEKMLLGVTHIDVIPQEVQSMLKRMLGLFHHVVDTNFDKHHYNYNNPDQTIIDDLVQLILSGYLPLRLRNDRWLLVQQLGCGENVQYSPICQLNVSIKKS